MFVDEKPVEAGKVIFSNLQAGTYKAMVYDENGNLIGAEEIEVKEGENEYTISVQEIPVEIKREEIFWQNLREFLTSPPLIVVLIFVIPIVLYILSKVKWEALEKEVSLWEYWR
jgi:hypothetical protein